MSRPRFLADHDFNEDIIDGVSRREPGIDIVLCRVVGLSRRADAEVLEFAATSGRIVLSHDVNTMSAAVAARIVAGLPMPGLLLAHQFKPVLSVIESLIVIWTASEAEEYANGILYLPL